ncbi:hypothetical protein [Streptomyces sp. NBC_01594]|uniref:hypothetical protein n=1 Tax=Streptomyces sp. NBC_01594 TaxID=2975890 RepID=UPI00386CDF88
MDDAQSRPPSLLALPSYLASHVARIGHLPLVDALAENSGSSSWPRTRSGSFSTY